MAKARSGMAPWIREGEDGSVEVVVARRGHVEHHRIDAGGTVVGVERVGWSRDYLTSAIVAWLGAALFIGVFVIPAAGFGEDDSRLLAATIVGVLLIWVGAGLCQRALTRSVRSRMRGDGWLQVASLSALKDNAAPMSLRQLFVVDRLTEECGQLSVFREHGEGSVEIVTSGDASLERRLVDRDGSVSLLETTPSSRLGRIGRTLKRRAKAAYGGTWIELDFRPSD